jgi:hypothetical protein
VLKTHSYEAGSILILFSVRNVHPEPKPALSLFLCGLQAKDRFYIFIVGKIERGILSHDTVSA